MTINRKIRMVLSILMCCAVLLSATSFAVDDASKRVISSAAASFFEEHGIPVSRTAIMDIVPLNYNDEKSSDVPEYALRLTDQNGSTVTETLYLFYGERSDGSYGIDGEAVLNLYNPSRAGGVPMTINSDIVVTPYYNYDFHSMYSGRGPFHRPISLTWSYYKLNTSVSVEYIDVQYVTRGIKCSLPNYTPVSSITESYTIEKYAALPVASIPYSNTSSSYPSNYVLDIVSGGGGVGIYFYVTINGHAYNDSY